MARIKPVALAAGLVVFMTTARGEAGTYTFTPSSDAQVVSDYPTTNYGTYGRLTADASPAAQSLIRFQVANVLGTVTSARLRIYVNNPSPDGPTVFRTTSACDEVDPYHEHWGEPAYLVAMAWFHGGKVDTTLKTAATQMLAGLKSYGSSPHMRSFNWQCRAAVAAPYYLK